MIDFKYFNRIESNPRPPRLFVFENNVQTKGRRAIKVHLHGIKSNTGGLGAMVFLYTVSKTDKNAKKVQARWVEDFQSGLPSQNESGVLFGVGEGFKVSGIKVRWPYLKKKGIQLWGGPRKALLIQRASCEGLSRNYPVRGWKDSDGKDVVSVLEEGIWQQKTLPIRNAHTLHTRGLVKTVIGRWTKVHSAK